MTRTGPLGLATCLAMATLGCRSAAPNDAPSRAPAPSAALSSSRAVPSPPRVATWVTLAKHGALWASGPRLGAFDFEAARTVASVTLPRGESVACAAWSADGSLLAAAGTQGSVSLWQRDGTLVAEQLADRALSRCEPRAHAGPLTLGAVRRRERAAAIRLERHHREPGAERRSTLRGADVDGRSRPRVRPRDRRLAGKSAGTVGDIPRRTVARPRRPRRLLRRHGRLRHGSVRAAVAEGRSLRVRRSAERSRGQPGNASLALVDERDGSLVRLAQVVSTSGAAEPLWFDAACWAGPASLPSAAHELPSFPTKHCPELVRRWQELVEGAR